MEIMRSLSEFMNPDLSTYIYGDDKKFLHFRYFKIMEFDEYISPQGQKEGYKDVVLLFTQELHLGRQWKLLDQVANEPNN